MNKLDLLLAIRQEFVSRACNYKLELVLTEEKWKEIVYKCICSNVTEGQVQSLLDLGFSEEEIRERLKIGHNCGICIKDEGDNNVKNQD